MRRDDSFTPSRLINVNPKGLGEDVVLEDKIPPGSAYIALSYCWGNYEPECLTTRDTVDYNMQRIPWSALPATFQDAVKFTRGLGIKYLWIDSICIIQRDLEDWIQQAGQMFHIYKNAYVTLAALYGRSSTSGLRAISMENQLFKIADLSLDEICYPVYIRRSHYQQLGKTGSYWDNIQNMSGWGPLLCRAWTYQERMISPRVLYFTESEIIFQCFSRVECECGAVESEGTRSAAFGKAKYFNSLFDIEETHDQCISPPAEEHGTDSKEQRDRIVRTWREDVLRGFSGLMLSRPSDRLPAIGAMAEQFQQFRPGETYLAGLWSGSLIEDLLWKCGFIEDVRPKNTLDRLGSVPTWSWASLQSKVFFPDDREREELLPAVEILEARCEYKENNPFGVLESSKLILRGKLLPCLAIWGDQEECRIFVSCPGDPAGPLQQLHKWGGVTEMVHMDHDATGYQSIPWQQNIYILEMKKGYGEGYLIRHYLILRREDKTEDIFSRAGSPIYKLDVERGSEKTAKGKFFDFFDEQSIITDCKSI
ncbi:heterokaryon incompatibility protein-domain-containing protein [Hypoxylon sp. FL1857]|nr:heterokaryon incompatibility protein-domain-containing protein [Hypoxylon sp. FL1857]